MVVNDRGERIKIKNLDFNGNDKFGNFILATKLKNTKTPAVLKIKIHR